MDTLNAQRDLMTSWSVAQKKKVLKTKLQQYNEDLNNLISSEQFYKVCHGEQRTNAIKKQANFHKKGITAVIFEELSMTTPTVRCKTGLSLIY